MKMFLLPPSTFGQRHSRLVVDPYPEHGDDKHDGSVRPYPADSSLYALLRHDLLVAQRLHRRHQPVDTGGGEKRFFGQYHPNRKEKESNSLSSMWKEARGKKQRGFISSIMLFDTAFEMRKIPNLSSNFFHHWKRMLQLAYSDTVLSSTNFV